MCLITEEVFLVCSSALLERRLPLEKPADLARHTLIHDSLHKNWRMWLLTAGAPEVEATRGPGYYLSNLVVPAAVAGEGLALGRSVLAAGELASEHLIRPFAASLPLEFSYYVVSLRRRQGPPKGQGLPRAAVTRGGKRRRSENKLAKRPTPPRSRKRQGAPGLAS